MMRKGIVVEVHPEDHSVDLVMADDASRLVGVQVMTQNGSTRTGSVDLPEIPKRKDKWDITEPTGQDMHAIVSYVGRHPVVVGFIYPQINQMLHKDPKLKVNRHQSDVTTSIDGDGNIQIQHPSGTYIRIGETPDKKDMKKGNADESMEIDRNTERRVNIRIGMADGVLTLTLSPTGQVTLECDERVSVKTKADMRFEAADTIKFKAPGGMTFDTPNGHFTNTSTANVDFVANNTSLVGHKHPGVVVGPAMTLPPTKDASSSGPEWD